MFLFSIDGMTFDEFVEVCRKVPATTEDDLMKAFRKIDINGDGYISLDELYKIMTTVTIVSLSCSDSFHLFIYLCMCMCLSVYVCPTFSTYFSYYGLILIKLGKSLGS